MMYNFHFQGFQMTYNALTGETLTIYPDGCKSGCEPLPEDVEHGVRLGITPGKHRILHETCHHLVANAKGAPTCPIVFADAHGLDMPPDAHLLEWQITAISYLACFKAISSHDMGALMDIEAAGGEPLLIAHQLRKLMQFEEVAGIKITKN